MLRALSSALSMLLLSLFIACAPSQRQEDAKIDALLWSTASAEYDVITRQVYYQAQRQLDRVLANRNQTAALEQTESFSRLPPAVIVDVDDVLLSNGALHYRLLSENRQFDSEVWAAWVNEARAKPIAGALDYVKYATQKGVTVIYVSNRDVSLMEGTRRNLQQLGFPLAEEQHPLLMLNGAEGWDADKSTRRAHIARRYRVVQIIGDGLGDFMGGTTSMSLDAQREASARHLDYWGERWFMLPNPVYGDWEKAILNGEDLPQVDPMRAKYRFIRGGESQGVW